MTGLLKLRFFRDLSESERIAVFVKLKILPENWQETMNHGAKTAVLEKLLSLYGPDHAWSAMLDVVAARKVTT